MYTGAFHIRTSSRYLKYALEAIFLLPLFSLFFANAKKKITANVFNISASGQSKGFVWLRCNALSIDPTFRPARLLHFTKLFLAQFPGKKCINTMKNNINFVKFNDLDN